MGFTAVVDHPAWQVAALLNEVVYALQERQAAVGIGLTPLVSAAGTPSDNVQLASLWRSWQGACEALADADIWVEDKSYDNEATIPVLTWADVLILADMPHGWRRVEGEDAPADWTDYDDAAYTYGQQEQGDQQGGPWLFADLQAILKVFVATKPGGLSTHEPEDQCWKGDWGPGAATCADAMAAAEANWASDPAPHGTWCMTYHKFGGVTRICGLEKRLQGVEFTGGSLWDGVARSCDWYAFCDPVGLRETFDANGETLYEGKFGLWLGEGTPETTANPYSRDPATEVRAYCPNQDVDDPLPVWVDCPPPDVLEYWKGFHVEIYSCVVRWNVAGGFTYV